MSHQTQLDELNSRVKTYIAPSPIHGVGVFALRSLPVGAKLYTDIIPKMYNLPHNEFSKLFPEVRDLLLERWPQIVNGSHFAYPDTRIQAFMNHSDTPNYDAVNDATLREIKKGEEITEDYRLIEGWGQVFPFLAEKAV